MKLKTNRSDSKFKVQVDCLIFNNGNKDIINNHLLKYIKDNGYSYIKLFCDPKYYTPRDGIVIADCNNIKKMTQNGLYINGMEFDSKLTPNYIGEDISNFIAEDYFEPIFYPVEHHKMLGGVETPDFSMPFFLSEQLKAKHLIIVDEIYEEYKKDIEQEVLNKLKDFYERNMKEILRFKIKNAKQGALMREDLDNRNIDWRKFPEEAENGIYHDDLINELSLKYRGGNQQIYMMDEEPDGVFDTISFTEEFLEKTTFNELCKLHDSDITWRMFYNGVLEGNEKDLFYISYKRDYMSKDDVLGGKKECNKYYGFKYYMMYFESPSGLEERINVPQKTKEARRKFFEYMKYNEGLDDRIINPIIKDYKIKLHKKKMNVKPKVTHISEYEEVKGKQPRLEDLERYKWEQRNSRYQKLLKEGEEGFFSLEDGETVESLD